MSRGIRFERLARAGPADPGELSHHLRGTNPGPRQGSRNCMTTFNEQTATGTCSIAWRAARSPAQAAPDVDYHPPPRGRPRGRADRGGVARGDSVPHAHRTDVRRQAPGVHPALGHARRVDAGRRHQPSQAARRDRVDRARTVSCRGRTTARDGRRPVEGRQRRSPVGLRRVIDSNRRADRGALLDVWQTSSDGFYDIQDQQAA